MSRGSYKNALRAKGIRPIPPHHKLRSYNGEGSCITASEPMRGEPANTFRKGYFQVRNIVFENCRWGGNRSGDYGVPVRLLRVEGEAQ